MKGFYISKITAFRNGKRESSLQFKDGLNIIYGPSNTGKTLALKYLDFIFGSKETPESDFPFDSICVELKSRERATATLTRSASENKVYITNSTINGLEPGEYPTKSETRKTISDVYLQLIGIENQVKVIANKNNSKNKLLTWRALKNFFFLEEGDIFKENVYFSDTQFNEETFNLACLYFLLNGESEKISKILEDPKEQKIKTAVVKDYITKKTAELTDRKNNLLTELKKYNGLEIDKIKSDKTALLTACKEELNNLLNKDLDFENTAIKIQEEISGIELLVDRLSELESQYLSDIERLKFIIDGERVRKNITQNLKCPYCSSSIDPRQHKTYIIAETKELEKTRSNLDELRETIKFNEEQIKDLEKQLEDNSKTRETNKAKTLSLRNQINAFLDSITEYDNFYKLQTELNLINELKEKYENELEEAEKTPETAPATTDIKTEIDSKFFTEIENEIDSVMKKTDFENYTSTKIDRKTFDLSVSDRQKKNQGKGYRAFLNSLYAHSLTKYLATKGKINPGFLILDSPLLTLKEAKSDEENTASDLMKKELMKAFTDNSFDRQTIIIENEIPDIDYTNVNLIQFTKDEKTGRYGFYEK